MQIPVMTSVHDRIARLRRSRGAGAVSAAAVGLLLFLAAPSVISALGSSSAPVGCHSSPGDFSDDFTTTTSPRTSSGDLSGDFSDDPCVLQDGGGSDDSGAGSVGGRGEVIDATPNFTG